MKGYPKIRKGGSEFMGFQIKDGVLKKYTRDKGVTKVVIPDGVTRIDDGAFWDDSNYRYLKSITIPKSVSEIGENAFSCCDGLKEVHITDLGAWMSILFLDASSNPLSRGASLYLNGKLVTDIVIPKGVTKIGSSAFRGCSSLTSITIPESVTEIEREAFYNCKSLTSITIPKSVTKIGENAFSRCDGLKEVHIADLGAWMSIQFQNDYFQNDYSNPLSQRDASLYLNDELVTDFVIPEGITEIEVSTFSGQKSLKSITIPASVTKIKDEAFNDCMSLTKFEVNENNPFFSALDGVLFDKAKERIVRYPERKKDSSYDIPEGVTEIEREAFYHCKSLTSITIPEGVTKIGESAFSSCISLTSIIIPESVTKIGERAFYGCESLTSIIIPDGVTKIGERAFLGCSSLTSIKIPESVTEIGMQAFEGCRSLTSITIPEGMTKIGTDAFCLCNDLKEVHIADLGAWMSIQFQIQRGDFQSTDSNPLSRGASLYLNDKLVTNIVIPEGVTKIGSSAFRGYKSLTSITIPEGVTKIGEYAFSYCESLTSITIPEGVTEIGEYAFSACSSLTSITIPKGMTKIEKGTFGACTSLISIIIPEGVTYIGGAAFSNCPSLTSITIPEGVTKIGAGAFYGCSSLTPITIPERVTSIGYNVFYGIKSFLLTSENCTLTLPVPPSKNSRSNDPDNDAIPQFIIEKDLNKKWKIVDNMKKALLKHMLSAFMITAYNYKPAKDYLKKNKNTKKIMFELIDLCNVDLITAVLNLGLVTMKNFDEIFAYLNAKKEDSYTEMKIVFLNYKHDHIGYQTAAERFKL